MLQIEATTYLKQQNKKMLLPWRPLYCCNIHCDLQMTTVNWLLASKCKESYDPCHWTNLHEDVRCNDAITNNFSHQSSWLSEAPTSRRLKGHGIAWHLIETIHPKCLSSNIRCLLCLQERLLEVCPLKFWDDRILSGLKRCLEAVWTCSSTKIWVLDVLRLLVIQSERQNHISVFKF